MKMRFLTPCFLLSLLISSACFSQDQSIQKGDIMLGSNIGYPHLFKGIIKLATNSDVFHENFDGILEVSEIKGVNPIAVKGEYGFSKLFGLGLSFATWNINFDVKDYYNIQNQSQGNTLQDSVDIYSFKISSKSFGIRPNLHIPLKTRKHDLFLGIGLGITKNKLTIGFNSTDAGRVAKIFGKDLELDLSLPGGIYFAPSIGYRCYFSDYIGANVEVGYEKGAIICGGVIFRIALPPKGK